MNFRTKGCWFGYGASGRQGRRALETRMRRAAKRGKLGAPVNADLELAEDNVARRNAGEMVNVHDC